MSCGAPTAKSRPWSLWSSARLLAFPPAPGNLRNEATLGGCPPVRVCEVAPRQRSDLGCDKAPPSLEGLRRPQDDPALGPFRRSPVRVCRAARLPRSGPGPYRRDRSKVGQSATFAGVYNLDQIPPDRGQGRVAWLQRRYSSLGGGTVV